MSGPGSSAESVQLQEEMRQMSKEDREELLMSLHRNTAVSPQQVLAFKADLAIPWNKLRIMRR